MPHLPSASALALACTASIATLTATFAASFGQFGARAAHAVPQAPSADAPDWERVRAVLERRCLECHGGEARKGGLSFATAEAFALGGAHGTALDADALERSRLIEVVSYANPDLAMPPTGVLPDDERALLEAWVLDGAPWPEGDAGRLADPDAHPAELGGIDLEAGADWWAYRPLVAPPVPQVDDAAWSAHAIDRFVKSELDARGIEPAPHATHAALVRRVHFDTTGLPPGLDDLAAFEDAVAREGFDAAWSALVDDLLASRAHAEHAARHWLDLVRYAETNGYERDTPKSHAWRYRDWVVRAIEDDLPYDRFVELQLAGDEAARIAPHGPIDGADAEAALGTGYFNLGVWDDEPADPLQARWDQIADVVDTTGQVFLGTTFGCARCHDHKADPVSQRDYYAFTAFFSNLEPYRIGLARQVADPPAPGTLELSERDARLAEIEARLRAAFERTREETPAEAPRVLVPDARSERTDWAYLALDDLAHAPDGWHAPGFDDGAWTRSGGGFGAHGTPGAVIGTEWTRGALLLRTTFQLDEVPERVTLALHHDDDVRVYLNGALVLERSGYTVEYGAHLLGPEANEALVVGRNVLAISCVQDFGGQYIDAGLATGRPAEADPLVEIAHAVREPAADGELVALWREREALRVHPVAEPYKAQVVRERGSRPEPTRVFGRGSAHAPGEVVEPRLPEVFAVAGASADAPAIDLGDDAGTSGRRLALARWLVGDGAFLTARVEANRVWQQVTGRGLCASPGDFGRLGRRPTHPELLDHLACELIASGWSRRALWRTVLTSRTYRASSVGPAASLASDPLDEALWRRTPRRLTAEQFRDAILAVAGLLDERAFGPSVRPPLDPAVLATSSRPEAAWPLSPESEWHRRSLYVFVQRSLRPPLLESLDQPSPDLPCPDRFTTNVPTQSLITLNGHVTVQAAQALAARLERERTDGDARLAHGYQLALGRPLDGATLARQRAFLAALTDAHGLSDREALEVWCLGLFNLNAFMWLD